MTLHGSWTHEGTPGEIEYEYRCGLGYHKEDRSETGTPADRISCVQCDEGEYPGPGWECKRCANVAKEYQAGPKDGEWTCQCISNASSNALSRTAKEATYVAAGDGCVAVEDRKALEGVIQGGDLE